MGLGCGSSQLTFLAKKKAARLVQYWLEEREKKVSLHHAHTRFAILFIYLIFVQHGCLRAADRQQDLELFLKSRGHHVERAGVQRVEGLFIIIFFF